MGASGQKEGCGFRELRFVHIDGVHLQRILSKYARYYNEVRTHLSLGTDASCTRPIERFGDIMRSRSSLHTMTWSVHSCRAEPIKRSTRPFCQGERTGAGHHPDHQAADEDQTAVRTPR